MTLGSDLLQWLFLGLLFWTAIITVLLVQTVWHYRRLTKSITKKDLKTALNQLLDQSRQQGNELDDLNEAVKKINEKGKVHLQKIGFVRFNPFPQTGGDQSFALSLLNENGSGFVLSSLHSRDTTRLYAKAVKNGKGAGYELSKEEVKAIKSAK